MSVTIRRIEPGDEPAQAVIYNQAAASLPGYKPTTSEEIRRRARDKDYVRDLSFIAMAGGETVGYCSVWPNGRTSYPWCLPGHEACQPLLFDAALQAARAFGLKSLFSAYRAEWTAQTGYLEGLGFRKTRDMINFVQNLLDLPTMVIRRGLNVSPVTPADITLLEALAPSVPRLHGSAFAKHLLENPYFPTDSVFVLRKSDGTPQGAGVLISNSEYASPMKVDSNMPCFRLGAFGTEGMTAKRINGVFSFLVREDGDATSVALDLLSYALNLVQDDTIEMLAAQVPGDAKHLVSFYFKYFRKQGSFPIYEMTI